MSQPPTPPAAPRWLNPTALVMAAAIAAAVTFTSLVVDLILGGWPITPSPLWSMSFTVIALLALAAILSRLVHWSLSVGERWKRQIDRDMTLIIGALHHAGYEMPKFEEITTGDIGKTIIAGYRHDPHLGNGHNKAVPTDNVRAFELGRRAERAARDQD